ncbi:MAG: hypothetical protein QN141_10585 [Armatimonadota bacterium]|nr:hypothetical protein [Armatimonadota bacterium]MDR7451506.1 hypothetical protein [Armatimonadota bacterium]MDR7467473.1 hypothetical protein [Armatimonadota bacterium]MDR7494347.1 hypothetical protein [Armatimonadota bacterium]MDR7499164.1 hypothetical protein [Armatimonadota bacterium]
MTLATTTMFTTVALGMSALRERRLAQTIFVALTPELWVGGVFFAAATGLGLALVLLPGGEPTEFQTGQGDRR